MDAVSKLRLRDLSDKEANSLLQKVFKALEEANGSANPQTISNQLEINELLFEDIIQVMIIKGWLETRTKGDEHD